MKYTLQTLKIPNIIDYNSQEWKKVYCSDDINKVIIRALTVSYRIFDETHCSFQILDKNRKIILHRNIKRDDRFWSRFSENIIPSEDVIRKFQNEVNWFYIFTHQKLSEDFIREFYDKTQFFTVLMNQKISENMIRELIKYKDKDVLFWHNVSCYQELSEDFIREFKDEVNWIAISKEQELSEDFMKEFKDEVNWINISKHQKLSRKFKKEFAKELGIKKKKFRFGDIPYLRRLCPIVKGHHTKYSSGYFLLPIFKKTIGYVDFAKTSIGVKIKGWKKTNHSHKDDIFYYKPGFKIIETKDLHNCTWTGKY